MVKLTLLHHSSNMCEWKMPHCLRFGGLASEKYIPEADQKHNSKADKKETLSDFSISNTGKESKIPTFSCAFHFLTILAALLS